MDALSLIRKKHAGGELSADQIGALVRGSLDGSVPDHQLAAFLMAVNYERLSFAETVALTRAFVDSGEVLDWGGFVGEPLMAPTGGMNAAPTEKGGINASPTNIFVDKHSTGGVGDKVSLLLTPWLAAAGFKVAKMSGRALGHTGGTIDKLESIPGFRTALWPDEARRILDSVGCVIMEQSPKLVPADKKWYALRDATDTVWELGLIAASVMSKKIACGAPYIVLDVKCGSGAFFSTFEQAKEFAELARRIGTEFGRKVACVISNMDQPLGRKIGTMAEVVEAHYILKCSTAAHEEWALNSGFPPQTLARTSEAEMIELCETLGACLLVLSKLAETLPAGRDIMRELLCSGAALESFYRWIAAQGGDWKAFQDDENEAELNWNIVPTTRSGYVQAIDGRVLGNTLSELRREQFSESGEFGHDINITLETKVGDLLDKDDLLLMLQHPDAVTEEVTQRLAEAFEIGDAPIEPQPIIREVLL